jgi:hypothetical protein
MRQQHLFGSRSVLWLTFLHSGLFLIAPQWLYGQNVRDTVLHAPVKIIPNTLQATELDTDGENNLYLLSPRKRLLVKLLAAAQLDSAIQVGGVGTSEESLVQPEQLQVHSRNLVYVLDRGTNALQAFNVNLRPIRRYSSAELFKKPGSSNSYTQPEITCYTVNPTGDIIAWSAGERLWSVNRSLGGNEVTEASIYSPHPTTPFLLRPAKTTDPREGVYIVKETTQHIWSVDPFWGEVIAKAELPTLPPWHRVEIWENTWCFVSDTGFVLWDRLRNTTRQVRVAAATGKLLDVAYHRGRLTVLTENEVLLYLV